MKIRTDFVTNSSSSSFVLAKKKEIGDKEKIEIANYLLDNHILGRKILEGYASDEKINEKLEKLWYRPERYFETVKNCTDQGYDIYGDTIDFEIFTGEEYTDILKNVWRILAENDDIVEIDFDLSY